MKSAPVLKVRTEVGFFRPDFAQYEATATSFISNLVFVPPSKQALKKKKECFSQVVILVKAFLIISILFFYDPVKFLEKN